MTYISFVYLFWSVVFLDRIPSNTVKYFHQDKLHRRDNCQHVQGLKRLKIPNIVFFLTKLVFTTFFIMNIFIFFSNAIFKVN